LASRANTAAGAGGASAPASPLIELQKKQDALAQNVQTELDSDRRALAGARRQKNSDLQAKISDLQGELELINARKNLLNTLSEFADGSAGGSGVGGLKAQIDAMAVALPSANIATASSAPAAPSGAAASSGQAASAAPVPALNANGGLSTRFGMWDLAENVFKLSEKAHTIKTVDLQTAALQATFTQIRTPLIDRLKILSARGDALAAQADAPNGTAQSDVRGQLDSLAAQFKATSALLIPLSKENLLLTQYRRNLDTWHDAVKSQYRDSLKRLGVRLGALLILLAIVFAAAELWKRAVLRYIQDTRRRYQFLLLRRIALWALIVVIIGFAFASELGSIVTFAGLITAGVAVAMQSVLVSIVGYFFLIGKYGIRVGDRVQIGEVRGEVIELGLVRLYLMELGGHGLTGPTGRVVAYANSIVFQVSTGLFKQIAGVNIAWHEITLNLPAGCDYAATKDKLLAAVNDVLKDYRDEIVRQTKEIQRTTMSDSAGDAQPQVQLNFASSGVQAIVRYPVHLQHAAEIDERMSRELLNAIPSTTT
jgi:small-conductance mechanosensitive channel